MRNPFITGTRVYLRALERADAAIILPWINDKQVIGNLTIFRPMSLAAEEAFIDAVNRSETDVVFGVCDRTSDKLIGVAGLQRIDQKNRHALFGIFIGEARNRGRGLGTETTALVVAYAFDTLNLNRVWLQVYQDNKAGIRAYEKVGFRHEGVLRQDHFRKGRYGNTVVMGVLRGEQRRAKAKGQRRKA